GEQHQLELLGGDRPGRLARHLAVGAEQGRLADPEMQVGRLGLHQGAQQVAQGALGCLVLRGGEVGRLPRGSGGGPGSRRLDRRGGRGGGGAGRAGGRGGGGGGRGARRGGGRPWGGGGGGGGGAGGGRRRDGLSRSRSLFRGDDRGEPSHLGDDAHPDHAAVRDVFELGLGAAVDVVRRFRRRDLDEQGVDVLVGERLLRDLARLAVLHQGDRLGREEVKLVAVFPQQDVDERIE